MKCDYPVCRHYEPSPNHEKLGWCLRGRKLQSNCSWYVPLKRTPDQQAMDKFRHEARNALSELEPVLEQLKKL